MRINRGQKGFTIIEAVVAAGVFAFVVAASLSVYMVVLQLDASSRAERQVLQNASYIMDFIAKEVRNGRINYSAENDADTLSLINQSDEYETITWNGSSNPTISFTKTGVGSTYLNSPEVGTYLRFYVSPSSDPLTPTSTVHVQPHVTIVLTVYSLNPKYSNDALVNVQSTFGIREYPSLQ